MNISMEKTVSHFLNTTHFSLQVKDNADLKKIYIFLRQLCGEWTESQGESKGKKKLKVHTQFVA